MPLGKCMKCGEGKGVRVKIISDTNIPVDRYKIGCSKYNCKFEIFGEDLERLEREWNFMSEQGYTRVNPDYEKNVKENVADEMVKAIFSMGNNAEDMQQPGLSKLTVDGDAKSFKFQCRDLLISIETAERAILQHCDNLDIELTNDVLVALVKTRILLKRIDCD